MSISLFRDSAIDSGQLYAARSGQLRIAIVNDAIAGRNGVGTYYDDLVKHLESHVACIQSIGPGVEPDPTLERFSINMPGDTTQHMSWPNTRRLYELLDAQQPNVIIVPSLGAFAFYGLKYARSRRVPVVVVNHTNFEDLVSLYCPALLAPAASWAMHFMGRWIIRRATAVAAMNSESLESARHFGAEHIRVMGTPLPPEFLGKPALPMDSQVRRAVFVGRLAQEKCIPKVLAAAEQLPEVEFRIAGDGPQRALVEQAAKRLRNLTYLGWVDRKTVKEEIDAAQVLVLPSAVETFGTVALEALARRRYVLTTEDCGISRWPSLSSGLFTLQSSDALDVSLRRLMEMPKASRDAHAEKSWDAVVQFHRHTIRVWTSFLVDAAAKHPSFAENASAYVEAR